MGGLCLLVKLHREGSAPAAWAAVLYLNNLYIYIRICRKLLLAIIYLVVGNTCSIAAKILTAQSPPSVHPDCYMETLVTEQQTIKDNLY